jgi:Mce-associated membrane protein
MPSRKPTSPVLDDSHSAADVTAAPDVDKTAEELSASEALALAEQAEAEAAEAEAVAVAARARAQALRLRRQAEAAKRSESQAAAESEAPDGDAAEDADGDVAEAAEPTVESEDPKATEVAASQQRRLPGAHVWKWVAAGVTVVLAVGLLAVSGVMMYHHRQVQNDQRRAAEFAAAARQGVVTLMSLDHTKAKEDVQRIIDISTGDFKADFEATADDFAKVAEQAKVTTEVQVNATAVKSMTDDSAIVLVAATSHISNSAAAKQDPRNWRLSVTVSRDGDQIKLAKVEFVP